MLWTMQNEMQLRILTLERPKESTPIGFSNLKIEDLKQSKWNF